MIPPPRKLTAGTPKMGFFVQLDVSQISRFREVFYQVKRPWKVFGGVVYVDIIYSSWWFKYFSFSPRSLRKWSNLTHIFQMGWFNHQLDMFGIQCEAFFRAFTGSDMDHSLHHACAQEIKGSMRNRSRSKGPNSRRDHHSKVSAWCLFFFCDEVAKNIYPREV